MRSRPSLPWILAGVTLLGSASCASQPRPKPSAQTPAERMRDDARRRQREEDDRRNRDEFIHRNQR